MLGGALERKMAPNWQREGERDKPGSFGRGRLFSVCPLPSGMKKPWPEGGWGQEGTGRAAGIGQDPADLSHGRPPSLTLSKTPV